jgi:uncharacterized protein YlxW (UPF0749 family)
MKIIKTIIRMIRIIISLPIVTLWAIVHLYQVSQDQKQRDLEYKKKMDELNKTGYWKRL